MKLAKAELFTYTNLIFVSIIQEAESICMGHDNSAPLVEEIPVKREKVSESILETATCLNLIVLDLDESAMCNTIQNSAVLRVFYHHS